jgi:hypothetical protein
MRPFAGLASSEVRSRAWLVPGPYRVPDARLGLPCHLPSRSEDGEPRVVHDASALIVGGSAGHRSAGASVQAFSSEPAIPPRRDAAEHAECHPRSGSCSYAARPPRKPNAAGASLTCDRDQSTGLAYLLSGTGASSPICR